MTYRNSAALTAIAAILFAAPAYAGADTDDATANMNNKEVFMKIDADGDNKLTFTEFANFSEDHGVSTSDAAQEFSRLAGQETTISMDGFADFDMAAMKAHKMDGSMKKMDKMESDMNMKDADDKMMAPDSMSSDSMSSESMNSDNMDSSMAMSDSNSGMMRVEYGDFAKLDADADGKVSFKEYLRMRKSQGLTSTTKAAQEFTRLTNGQAMLSADQYQVAMSNDVLNRPMYRSQTNVSSSSMNENMEKDMMHETKSKDKMSKDKVNYPTDNNPAGLNQMNDPRTMSHMTNSGVKTDLEKSSNPQMKVRGEK